MSEPALCKSCGRRIEKAGTRVYCSKRCSKARIGPLDRELESKLMQMLDARVDPATLCPSEVARAVGDERWRDLMEPTRRAGRRLAARGEVEFLQRGRVVDPATVRGPVRLRRRR